MHAVWLCRAHTPLAPPHWCWHRTTSHYQMTNWRRQKQVGGETHSLSDGPHLHLLVVHTPGLALEHTEHSSLDHLLHHCHCPRRGKTGVERDVSEGHPWVVRVGRWASEVPLEFSFSLRPLAASSLWPCSALWTGAGKRRRRIRRGLPLHAS